MKDLAIAVSILALSTSLLSAAEPNPGLTAFFQRLKGGQKQTVVAYGTSVTKYGGWVELMQQWFDEKFPGQVTVINSGGPGQHSGWGVAQVQKEVLAHHPDLLFIEFATNDAHTRFKMPVETGKENLDKIVKAVQEQNPKVAIVLQTMNAFWDAPKGLASGDSSRPRIEDYNNNYRSYAKEHNLALVDNYPVWLKMKQTDYAKFQQVIPDGTHPNKNGILAVTWPNIKELLETTLAASKR